MTREEALKEFNMLCDGYVAHHSLSEEAEQTIRQVLAEPDYELILQNKDLEIAKLHDEKEYYKSDSENWRSMCEEMADCIKPFVNALEIAEKEKVEPRHIMAIVREHIDYSDIVHSKKTLTKYNAMERK